MNMDDFVRLPAADRTPYFTQAAANLGTLRAQLVEKDFWVCWLIRRLFELPDIGPHLTFKGGTSLSKAYQAIDRFSEDVDLTIERELLGFGGENEPKYTASRKQRERQLGELAAACRHMIADSLVPTLRDHVTGVLLNASWSLELASDDPDGLSILFNFPATELTGTDLYFRPSIKLELEPRAERHPAEDRLIKPYLDDALPGQISDPATCVRVLHINRTFWEKATILHMLAHKPVGTPLASGMSRHYYDLHRLALHAAGENAVRDVDLLLTVAAHKAAYFSSAQARYEDARPGSLRLVPDKQRIAELAIDYAAMKPMFFGACPALKEVIVGLRELETVINAGR